MMDASDPQTSRIACIVPGPCRSAESQATVEWLEMQPDVELVPLAGLAETERYLTAADSTAAADLVVLFEQAPGDFPPATVDRLLRLRPLLRIVCCQGRWSESAGRTDPIWPEAMRISTRCAIPRLALELDSIQGRLNPLPFTASRDEVYAFHQTPAVRCERRPVRVHVESDDVAWRMTIEEWFHAGQPADRDRPACEVVIADLDPWSNITAQRVARIRDKWPETGIVGIGHWLPDEVDLAGHLGLDEIVARLCPLWYVQAVATRVAPLSQTSSR